MWRLQHHRLLGSRQHTPGTRLLSIASEGIRGVPPRARTQGPDLEAGEVGAERALHGARAQQVDRPFGEEL